MHWILFWGFVFMSASLHIREAFCYLEWYRKPQLLNAGLLYFSTPALLWSRLPCPSWEPGTSLLASGSFLFQTPKSIWQPLQSKRNQAMTVFRFPPLSPQPLASTPGRYFVLGLCSLTPPPHLLSAFSPPGPAGAPKESDLILKSSFFYTELLLSLDDSSLGT